MILRVALIQRSISALCTQSSVRRGTRGIHFGSACVPLCARDGRVRRSVHEHTYLSVLVDSLPLALSIPCVGCGIDPQTSRFYHSVSYNLNKTLCNGAGGLVPCGCLARLASFLGPHQ